MSYITDFEHDVIGAMEQEFLANYFGGDNTARYFAMSDGYLPERRERFRAERANVLEASEPFVKEIFGGQHA